MKIKIILIGLYAAMGLMPMANAWEFTPRKASLAVAGVGFVGLLGTQIVQYFGKDVENAKNNEFWGAQQSSAIKELEAALKENDWTFLQEAWIKGRLKDLTYLYAPSSPEEKESVEQDIRTGIAKKNKAQIQKALAKIKAQVAMETFEYVLEKSYWEYLQKAWIKGGLTELISLHKFYGPKEKRSIEQDIRNGIKNKDKEQIYGALREIKKQNRHLYHWDGHIDHDAKIREISAWRKQLVGKAKSAAPKFFTVMCLGLLGAAVLPSKIG